MSAAQTSTLRALPAATASSAALRALVPQRSEPPKSAVAVSGGRSSTEAMVAADCFSL